MLLFFITDWCESISPPLRVIATAIAIAIAVAILDRFRVGLFAKSNFKKPKL